MAVLCPDVLDGIVVGHSRQCGAIGESADPILHGRGETLVLMALSDNLDELAITLIDIRSKAAKHLVVADVGSELRSLPLQGDAFGGRLDGLQVSRNVCAHALQIAVGVEPNVDFVAARSEPDIVAAVAVRIVAADENAEEHRTIAARRARIGGCFSRLDLLLRVIAPQYP
ncbi:MAG: hypothetical protein O3A82_06135 [Verrucomicrobia bacterium]|nr:hypothetical protein [Verrucomicrobiota bacterium]